MVCRWENERCQRYSGCFERVTGIACNELRVKLPHDGVHIFSVQSNNRKNAEAAAEEQTGGKIQGGSQLLN